MVELNLSEDEYQDLKDDINDLFINWNKKGAIGAF